MARRELHHTLLEALEGLTPPTDTGLLITAASLDLPLELTAIEREGHPIMTGSAPHTRWVSGFLPPVHIAHLELELLEDPEPPRRRGGG